MMMPLANQILSEISITGRTIQKNFFKIKESTIAEEHYFFYDVWNSLHSQSESQNYLNELVD